MFVLVGPNQLLNDACPSHFSRRHGQRAASARRSHRPTHRSARGTESTPSHFDEGCSMHGESRIATSACPTMDSCDTSVLTPCRKSSIAVLSPRLCGNIKSRQWLRRRLAVPGTPYLIFGS